MFKIAWAGCDNMGFPSPGWEHIAAHRPRLLAVDGDTPYANGNSSGLWGLATSPAFTATTTQAEALAKFQQFWNKPNLVALRALRTQGMLIDYIPDDHEWPDDNWDHSPDNLGGSFTTQALINQTWKRVNDALEQLLATHFDNPPYDRVGNTTRPSYCTTGGENPPTTDYPIKYFARKFDANGNIGGSHCWVLHLDNMSYKSRLAEADGVNKHALGLQQEEWLGDMLSDAVAARVTHTLINSPKKFFRGTSDNGDTLGEYPTARNRVMSLIKSVGSKPTVMSCDRHIPHVMNHRVSSGALCDLLDVCACPIGVDLNTVSSDVPGLIWQGSRLTYGVIEVGERMQIRLEDCITGSAIWKCEILPYDNAPNFDLVQVIY